MADDAEINAATKPGKDQKNNPYGNRSGRAIFSKHRHDGPGQDWVALAIGLTVGPGVPFKGTSVTGMQVDDR